MSAYYRYIFRTFQEQSNPCCLSSDSRALFGDPLNLPDVTLQFMAQGHQILYHYDIIYFYYSNNNIVKSEKYQLQVFQVWNVFEIFNTKCFRKNL